MTVMGHLLAGQAPLRGRASMELLVRPFGYREAAAFWGVTDPQLAVLLHAIVGGTPAYRREFVAFDAPADLADFDAWVLRTVLNPQSPLFREARYLLAEEPDIRDHALYHSVLAAIASGNSTNGGIASYVGRKSAEITHPLTVLEECALIARQPDMFRAGRAVYRVTEPLISFYEAIMQPDWFRLESGQADAVWRDQRPTFLSRVVGPHFEDICRRFAEHAAPEVFGGIPGEVGQMGGSHGSASPRAAGAGARPPVRPVRHQRLRARLLLGQGFRRRRPGGPRQPGRAHGAGRSLPRLRRAVRRGPPAPCRPLAASAGRIPRPLPRHCGSPVR
jgi:hypothetical protein